jgi:hypothetical protein
LIVYKPFKGTLCGIHLGDEAPTALADISKRVPDVKFDGRTTFSAPGRFEVTLRKDSLLFSDRLHSYYWEEKK